MLWFISLMILLKACSASPPPLAWVERFDVFDVDVWKHMVTAWGGGNDEFQYYRNNRNNSFVKDGLLHIRPTFVADEFGEYFLKTGSINDPDCNLEPCRAHGNDQEIVPPVFSARISTEDSFSFKYGRIEVRAKMPRGDWLWPAIWLMPKDSKIYGGWPTGGEIDLTEIRGNRNYTDRNGVHHGLKTTASTLHFGPNPSNNKYHLTHWPKSLTEGDFSDDFHTFSLEWTNCSMRFLLDDVEYGKVEPPQGGFWELGNFKGYNVWQNGSQMAPFDQEFFIILNVAVGGRFFGDDWLNNGQPRPWTWQHSNAKKQFWAAKEKWLPTWDRPELLIDHIFVYSHEATVSSLF